MSDIFISYAGEDRPRAQMLAERLEGHGLSIFWDRTIPIGKTWRETIGRELNGARCVIVLWSKNSIESDWVQEEADHAKRRGVLVPVLIENVQPPIGFGGIQAAHLEDWDGTETTQVFRSLIAGITALIPPSTNEERKQTEVSPDGQDFEAGTHREKLQRIDTIYRCCTAIGRIANAESGDPAGTGFLMSGADLCPDWENGPVFLTNSAVISLDPADEAPLRPLQAEIEFTRLNGRPRVRLGELLYSSQRIEMNIAIFRIIAPPDAGVIPLCPVLPEISSTSTTRRVYVIGHPKGQELEVSMNDNGLVGFSRWYVHYRTRTEEGNSGSPVLDDQLRCFAVHHRKLKKEQLNQGIVLEAVISAIAHQRS